MRTPHAVGLVAILVLVLVACGATASDGAALEEQREFGGCTARQPCLRAGKGNVLQTGLPNTSPARVNNGGIAVPVSSSTPLPESASDASDVIVFVTAEEPQSLSSWSSGCSGGVSNAICGEIASDPLTWFDSASLELVPLTGVESWQQRSPNRWRFHLRDGVTFHNGEVWNAEAAARGLNYLGDAGSSGHGSYSFGFHGVISGQVIDDTTVDVLCQVACPIFPRTAIYTSFQAPEWWESASQDERDTTTVGLGPYRIVEYVSGVEVVLEAHQGYLANNSSDSRLPVVKAARQVWHSEQSSRAAMVQTGEAHWAMDIGMDNAWFVPVARTGTTNQVFTLVS